MPIYSKKLNRDGECWPRGSYLLIKPAFTCSPSSWAHRSLMIVLVKELGVLSEISTDAIYSQSTHISLSNLGQPHIRILFSEHHFHTLVFLSADCCCWFFCVSELNLNIVECMSLATLVLFPTLTPSPGINSKVLDLYYNREVFWVAMRWVNWTSFVNWRSFP